ncbi:hypothetical protein BDN72DRAFT_496748 [Pluteus cervinus]|uniref:Uncharacterized protein n=1 Tax=Pluteus cervinus TaxID=181527 RepID=A0ACD3AY92_9AGAR|nr:hypothetical protein BDN72DRAFT_496748 [Pluteus cervinus]
MGIFLTISLHLHQPLSQPYPSSIWIPTPSQSKTSSSPSPPTTRNLPAVELTHTASLLEISSHDHLTPPLPLFCMTNAFTSIAKIIRPSLWTLARSCCCGVEWTIFITIDLMLYH